MVGERYREGTCYIAGLIMAGEIFREIDGDPGALAGAGTGRGCGRERGRGAGGAGHACWCARSQGDIHDLGKNLLVMLLRSAGHTRSTDLGVDVPAEDVVRSAHEVEPDFIGLSGLLLTSFPTMVLDVGRAGHGPGRWAGARRVIVGGGQMTSDPAGWIGAARWSDNVGAAVPGIVVLVVAARAAR